MVASQVGGTGEAASGDQSRVIMLDANDDAQSSITKILILAIESRRCHGVVFEDQNA